MAAAVVCEGHKELQRHQSVNVLYELYHCYSVDQAVGFVFQVQVGVVAVDAPVACVGHKELQHRQTEKVCDVLCVQYFWGLVLAPPPLSSQIHDSDKELEFRTMFRNCENSTLTWYTLNEFPDSKLS